jgi:hypothetical protein
MAATMPATARAEEGAERAPLLACARAALGQLLQARGSGLEVVRLTRTAIETAWLTRTAIETASVGAQGSPTGLAVKMALGVCAEADECFKAMDGELTKLSTALTLLADTEHGGGPSAGGADLRRLLANEPGGEPGGGPSAGGADLRRQVRELRSSLEVARTSAASAHATLERERKRHATELGERREAWGVEMVHQLAMQKERLTEQFVIEQLDFRAEIDKMRTEIDKMRTAEQRMHGNEIMSLGAEELGGLQEQLEGALRRVEQLRACYKSVSTILPSTTCPIGLGLMIHPVFAADGYSYEKSEIERWFAEHGDKARSPMTTAPLAHHDLVENHALKSTIREMVEAQMRQLREAAGGAGAKRQRAAE